MSETTALMFIITVCLTFLWVGFWGTLSWLFYKMIIKPYKLRKFGDSERARRINDRRG